MKKLSEYVSSSASIDEIKKEVLSHPSVIKMLNQHGLDASSVDQNLTDLYRYVSAVAIPRGSHELEHNSKTQAGYYPTLVVHNNQLCVEYVPTDAQVEQMKVNKKKAKLKSMYMPEKDYEDFDDDSESRRVVVSHLQDFIMNDDYVRGIYLHGKPGVGKTRILTVSAKKIAKERNVLFVNYPDFVREIKSSIGDNTLEDKIKLFKSIDVLILDDFGDEGLGSAWFRDEVLMPILQTRMSTKKPVFFGSNYSMEQLEYSFENMVKDPVKVERLIERIKTLAVPIELKGKNYRQ